MHSERQKLQTILAFLSAIGLMNEVVSKQFVKSYSTYKIKSVSIFLFVFSENVPYNFWAKNGVFCVQYILNFNFLLTNKIVSFEQLGPKQQSFPHLGLLLKERLCF